MSRWFTRMGLAVSTAVGLILAGCAAPYPTVVCERPPPPKPRPVSYVVLLPSPDGSVGRVVVQGQGGRQELSRVQQGTQLDGASAPFEVSTEQLQRDFGAARAAQPPLPEQFMLYFQTGGTELTAESKALLQQIRLRAQARKSVDVSVIGHTDTQGRPEANEALGLQRARAIADQLRSMGLDGLAVSIESHGARNLLVPTPDQTAEPRNRRVEITLR